MDKNVTATRGWKLWLQWTLASVLGAAAGIAGALAVLPVTGDAAAALLLGLGLGLGQWLILRRVVRRSGWWIAASALGVAPAFMIVDLLNRAVWWSGPTGWLLALQCALAGALTGLGQWLLLREQIRRAGWWVLVSCLTWLAGLLPVWLISLPLPDLALVSLRFTGIGLLLGAGTGALLVRLLRIPKTRIEKSNLSGKLAFASVSLLLLIVLAFISGPVPQKIANPDLGVRYRCTNLPPLECTGNEDYCKQIVFFKPVEGPGYINYPVNGETAENQYRSYLRREVMIAIQHAAARVACETQGWTYVSPPLVLGLGDMSEADGSIPGTSIGQLGHPLGTHEGGLDIDLAYYQAGFIPSFLYMPVSEYQGNLLRPVCMHTKLGVDLNHCIEPPVILDRWRTALFIAYLSEHPLLRVVGVDGQIGPQVESALDALTAAGWIDRDLRASIPLAYEQTNENHGWYLHHHHHMHVSFNPR